MLLREIRVENILSFGQAQLELRPLNVLIGPNASGKSNLLRTLGLLRALPKDLQKEISEKGGLRSWVNQKTKGTAQIRILGDLDQPFDYQISFGEVAQRFEIFSEKYAGVFERQEGDVILAPLSLHDKLIEYNPGNGGFPRVLYHMDLAPSGKTFASAAEAPSGLGWVDTPNKFSRLFQLSRSESALAMIRHPSERRIQQLSDALESIRLYRGFNTGSHAGTRDGIASTARADRLSEDGSNVALVLNEINFGQGLARFNKSLQRFCDFFEDVRVLTRSGITQFYIKEQNVDEAFAASSLSDGTLRLICLLAILLQPEPPGLVCIEEPETGMHPDSIRMLAELLAEASTRTQLIVTTHSPALVDALSDQPEAIIVCERNLQGFTEFRRLRNSDLDQWLERYSLGQLWEKGEIGGNRW